MINLPISTIAFKHGVSVQELPSPIVPMTQVSEPVVAFGTAPIHLAQNPAPSNVPVLCSTLNEFVEQFGWSDDFDSFTLCEVARCHFSLYSVSPIVCINVLDTTKHATTGTQDISSVTNPVKIRGNVINASLKITSGEDETLVTLTSDDFTAVYDDEGNTIITFTTAGLAKIVDNEIFITYREVDPTAVTASTIVGGVDLMTGKNTGLEVIEDVYPRLAVVPGTIIAPKFSTNSEVALAMAAKSKGINGCFKALAIADISTTAATKYSDVASVKTSGNFNNQHLVVCWPKVSLGGVQYHLSTQLAALMNVVDAEHDLIPYKSPSNEFLQIDSSVLSDGTEVYLGRDLANYVNSQGVATALNFGGFRSWLTHVSIYPNDTDAINFVAVRRMLNFLANNLILNFFSRIDNPMNRVLIDTVLDSARTWLNGLASRGAILGGQIACLEEDNPVTSLTKGEIDFRLNVGFAIPAVNITFNVQYDSSYTSTLFATAG